MTSWCDLTKPQRRALRVITLLGQQGGRVSKRTCATHRTINGDVAQTLVRKGLARYQWVGIQVRIRITERGTKIVNERQERCRKN